MRQTKDSEIRRRGVGARDAFASGSAWLGRCKLCSPKHAGASSIKPPGEGINMTITTRIIAAATFASALAFAPAALADASPAPQTMAGMKAHDCAHPTANCGCHGVQHANDKARTSTRASVQKNDVQPSNGYTNSGVPRFTDAG
jgi:hypothetical protein